MEHRFMIDQLVSVWERYTYIIEAETVDEAKVKAREIYDKGYGSGHTPDTYQILGETKSALEPDDSNPEKTRELIHDSEEGDTVMISNGLYDKRS